MLKFFILLLTTPLLIDILKEQLEKLGIIKPNQEAEESQESDSIERIRFVQTINDQIYWMEDGKMYTADLNEDGMWEPDDKQLVSFDNLSRTELEKLITIIDALTER